MKAASVRQIKQELDSRSPEELASLCLKLARFKKENKEMLTYLLFEADNENGYIEGVKEEIDEAFVNINRKTLYLTKKNVRKILRIVKKYIRYSKKKTTEIELLVHFSFRLQTLQENIGRNTVLTNILDRQVQTIQKSISQLHEDYRADYLGDLEELLAK